ncbi:TetR/AcrR family transcriptional regulator [Bdellovibrio sp. NC01]|uniref:TetR/AcrR family transcriptional regulator n=1 Tax=Bdellovibrio sp. NC01 TaxID=2220073 RepID=UPI00143DBD6C|nr:TetR/AcrR family transcriptional regulator [Bdellovibrio sp. NC01]
MDTNTNNSDNLDKRQAIIQKAYEVFYKEGFHAAGVDSLLDGTGISKRTLYKYFASKEELIQAVIEHYSNLQFKALETYLADHSSPAKKILALFDWLSEMVATRNPNGCLAINAKMEYAHKHDAIEGQSSLHFSAFYELIYDLCKAAHCHDAKKVAKQIHILFQGAVVGGQTEGNPEIAQLAKGVAKSLLEQALH